MNNISNKILASMLVMALIAVTGVVTTVSMARAQGDIDWAEFSRAAGEAYGKALAGLGVSSPTTPDGAFGGTVELTETQFAAGIKIGDASSYTFPTTGGSSNGGKLLSLNAGGTALEFSSLAVAGVNNLFATNTPDILISTNTGADSARYRMVLGGTATTVQNVQFEVIGDTQLDYASSTYLTVDGPVHFNDTAAGTADVTMEGDTMTDLFFADVSVNRIGIGTTSPAYLFDIDGDFNVGVGDVTGATSTNQFYVRTDKNGSLVGINGTTTPFGYLAINADNRYQAFTVGSSTATVFEIETDGTVKINDEGASYIDFIVEGDAQANLLMVDASADRVGIATSTPFAVLAVHALAGQNAFLVGSTTNELFKIDASGAVSFNGGGWPNADFTVQGDTQSQLFFVDASADRVTINGAFNVTSGLSTASTTLATTTVTALTQGGGVYSTTTFGSATLLATELESRSVLNFGSNAVSNKTITMPASSTLSAVIPNAGDRRSWIFTNDTSTAGIYLTFADGTGVDLRTSTSTPNSLILPPRDSALLTCWRNTGTASSTDIGCFFDAFE